MNVRCGWLQALSITVVSVCLAGCGGLQSALPGLGVESERIAMLFRIMLIGACAVLALVTVAGGLALYGDAAAKRLVGRRATIVAAGVGLPAIVLSALLIYGFRFLDTGSGAGGAEPIRIAVVGEQWWWRITYRSDDQSTIAVANELRVPVGRPVELELTAADVIHSFWVPPLAGKVDMIPGQVNTLRFTATSTGIVRGQCAEYCGGAHALMSFYVVVEPPAAFADWLETQASDARSADAAGASLFLASGCGGCHSIRGTAAAATIGPDLTHVGSRISIGAGLLRTGPDAFARWIGAHHRLKPGNRMPPFEALSEGEVARLAAYLAALE